jgi:hypothetical protein
MNNDSHLALFLMIGQSAAKASGELPEITDGKPLYISKSYDVTTYLPETVKLANQATEGYRLFFVFENYLRKFIIETLTKDGVETWWEKIPPDVQSEIDKLEENEEQKRWMSLGSRDKSALMTYPQLLRVIDHNWKDFFQDIVRDKALIQEARWISHLRNTICHMSSISPEEIERTKQVMRDWFRMVSP